MHQSFAYCVSVSVNVKANEDPGYRGKNTEWSPPTPGYSSPVCAESAVTAFLKSPRQTSKKTTWPQATQIIYVKCSNYQVALKYDHWQIKYESPAHSPTCWAKKWKRFIFYPSEIWAKKGAVLHVQPQVTLSQRFKMNTVEPPWATTSRKRPPPVSDHPP